MLASRNPNGQPTNGVVRVQTTESSFTQDNSKIKFARTGSPAWPAEQYLNIWVCNLENSLLGYAQFPDQLSSSPQTDGVVINTNAFGRIGYLNEPRFNRGRTATHEVGHWLDLRHIWGFYGNPTHQDPTKRATCNDDDMVNDTPVQLGWTYHCPPHPQISSCNPSSHEIMFQNYMDYTDDECMNLFTNGQKIECEHYSPLVAYVNN